jgi:hypothetical protein
MIVFGCYYFWLHDSKTKLQSYNVLPIPTVIAWPAVFECLGTIKKQASVVDNSCNHLALIVIQRLEKKQANLQRGQLSVILVSSYMPLRKLMANKDIRRAWRGDPSRNQTGWFALKVFFGIRIAAFSLKLKYLHWNCMPYHLTVYRHFSPDQLTSCIICSLKIPFGIVF